MKDMAVPPLVAPTTVGSLADLPARKATERPDAVGFRRRLGDRWVDVTYAEFLADVRQLAKGLVAAGVQVGDRVGLMSKTRYEWTVADFAVWTAGAVVVPVYETSSAEQIAWICTDSSPVAILVETADHAATVAEVRDQLPDLRDVWQIDAGAVEDLVKAGVEVSDDALDARAAQLDRTAVATVIYTSGTTGRPKGCELTHDNFMAVSENAVARLSEVVSSPDASTLLFLPLAHVFARLIEVLCVQAGARIGHTADVTRLLDDLASFQPTFILAVPRVFEKIYNASEAKAAAEGKGRIFHLAADTAIAWSTARDTGGGGPLLAVRHLVFDRLVYRRLRAAMGGKVAYAVSGGAPLGPRLGHFYRGVGLTVLEGYGLTETTAPVSVNTPDQTKIGSVGPPLPGVAVRVADDGEVLVQGNNVFRGYRGNEAATREALADGWFHTGDIGELDDDGFLRITGRIKEIIVTAGGKNVAPAVLEDRLRAHPLVSQCLVVGDQKPFIAALLTLDAEMLPTWAANHGVPGLTLEQARSNDVVLAGLGKAVERANKAVSRAESIRTFTVLADDFTEANGYLTPSLKLKRRAVMEDFADQVEAMYAQAED